jgi:OmpA-OmpF porin, OOP family
MDLLKMAAETFSGDTLKQISGFVGADEQTTGKGLAAAVPAVITALAGQAKSSEAGAAGLFDLVTKQFGGGLLDNLGDFMKNPMASGGLDLLGTVFGGNLGKTEEAVAKTSGLTSGAVSNLLAVAAPILLSLIGKHVNANGLDANGFTDLLKSQESLVRNNMPGIVGWLERIDANDDGSIVDDVQKWVGGLFGKKTA